IADFQNGVVSSNDPCIVYEHIEMIRHLRELPLSGDDTVGVRNIYFQKTRLPAVLYNLIDRFATSLAISRADEHIKSPTCELSRHFAPDAFIRSSDYRLLHTLLIERLCIFGLQKILEQ